MPHERTRPRRSRAPGTRADAAIGRVSATDRTLPMRTCERTICRERATSHAPPPWPVGEAAGGAASSLPWFRLRFPRLTGMLPMNPQTITPCWLRMVVLPLTISAPGGDVDRRLSSASARRRACDRGWICAHRRLNGWVSLAQGLRADQRVQHARAGQRSRRRRARRRRPSSAQCCLASGGARRWRRDGGRDCRRWSGRRAASGRRRWHLLQVEHFRREMRLARLAELASAGDPRLCRGGSSSLRYRAVHQ